MATKNEAHDMVIESLTQGLLQLMTQKPLAQINVSELCDRAGVSRVSFYRNFKSMQDILIQYLTACTDEWYQTFSQKPDEEFLSCFCVELLEQYRRHADLIRLLYNNDAAHLLKEHIFACCKLDEFTAPEEAYPRAVLAGRSMAWWTNGYIWAWDSFPSILACAGLSPPYPTRERSRKNEAEADCTEPGPGRHPDALLDEYGQNHSHSHLPRRRVSELR